MVMSEYNPGALNVLMQMIESEEGQFNISLLDSLGIYGSKIWMVYSDCCDKNFGKFYRTIMVLKFGSYTKEEITKNLELNYALPFLDDTVKIDGVPDYDKPFDIFDRKWKEYVEANRKVVVPKINERYEIEQRNQTR